MNSLSDWRRRRAGSDSSLMFVVSSSSLIIILICCVQCSHGGVVVREGDLVESIVPSSCGGGLKEYLGGVLREGGGGEFNSNSDASHFGRREGEESGGNKAEFASNTTLCKAGKNPCCTSSLIPKLLPSLVPRMFNNSQKLNAFKTQINSDLDLLRSFNGSGNAALWNATVEGMTVLKNWGIKYWDAQYLQRHNVFSNDCMRILVQNWVCPGCGEVVPEGIKPCRTLCHNTVMGCLKSPLAEFLESPWKHAVNSVRTAVRLIMTTNDGSTSGVFRQDDSAHPLFPLIADLNDWREPVTWWLPEYKRSSSCESLPSFSCWNGETVGRYEFPAVTWRSVSSYNPEFGMSANQGMLDPSVTLELDQCRNELVTVRKILEKFWPSASHNISPVASLKSSALPLTSLEDLHTEGSGDMFESDDEDLEYINSGNGPHIESDDEDLEEYGSGSGDDSLAGDIFESDTGIGTSGSETNAIDHDGPPVQMNTPSTEPNAGGKIRHSCTLFLFLFPLLFIFN